MISPSFNLPLPITLRTPSFTQNTEVEHPITELVTGEDLVEHMLYIAAGQKIPDRLTSNPHLNATGSAIESRVYAEDPLRGFLPSIGPLITYREPLQFTPETLEGRCV